MSPIRRVYRRVTTTERVALRPILLQEQPLAGQYFRVDVIKKDGPAETTVYSREHKGKIDVEEESDGSFRLFGSGIEDDEKE